MGHNVCLVFLKKKDQRPLKRVSNHVPFIEQACVVEIGSIPGGIIGI